MCLVHQVVHSAGGLAIPEGLDQTGESLDHPVEQVHDAFAGLDGAVQNAIQKILDRPGQFTDAGCPHEPAAALEGMEGAADLAEGLMVLVVGPEGGVVLLDGLQHLVGLFHKDLKDVVIQQFGVAFLGWLRGGGGSAVSGCHVRGASGFRLWGLPGGFAPGWEPEAFKPLFGHGQDGIVVVDTVHQPLQMVFDAGDGVGEGIELFPVGGPDAVNQHFLDEALAGFQGGGGARQRNQMEAAADAVEQFRYTTDGLGIPLGGDEIDHSGLHLFQRVAGFAQHRAARLGRLEARDPVGIFAAVGGLLVLMGIVTVRESGNGGFHIEQGPGDVHQCAVVHGIRAGCQLVDPVDLVVDHPLACALAQHGERVGHLAQAREQLREIGIAALVRTHEQVEPILDGVEFLGKHVHHRGHGRPRRCLALAVVAGAVRERLPQAIALHHGTDTFALAVRATGDVIEQVLQCILGHGLAEDGVAFADQPFQLTAKIADQCQGGRTHGVVAGIQGIDKGARGLPDLTLRGFLAEFDQARDDLVEIVQVGVHIHAPFQAGSGELEHLLELAHLVEYAGGGEALVDPGRCLEPCRAQVRVEQGAGGEEGFAACGPQVIEQRQQPQWHILAAGVQGAEVIRQLQDALHQAADGRFAVPGLLVEQGFGQGFHLRGDQAGALELDHPECAVNLVQVVQAEPELGQILAVLGKGLQRMLALSERVLDFAPHPVEGKAVIVLGHDHSGCHSGGPIAARRGPFVLPQGSAPGAASLSVRPARGSAARPGRADRPVGWRCPAAASGGSR